ncbi:MULTISPECIES: hypothetical protein [unclassified Bradyrhizobium]|uniref:hypothetical protein n=1 Tax=unclassified Bradyrhizobium TaxID=2631580 RepID=UPI00040D6CBC|nr:MULTISPECIES: hypothetical protein [unclassified Bradyrhizobium]QIG92639.1 hypothetical protein G6P99_09055 [Bradyrhizobium sp. 6(2017)]
MDASRTMIQSFLHATGSRRWRSLLAGLISLALVLSLFHPCACDSVDDTGSAVSIAQSSSETGDKAPAHPASLHCDHCLTHVAPMIPQDTVIAIAYAPHTYSDASVQPPASAGHLSPFKPPRA